MTLKSFLSLFVNAIPALPDVAHLAEETSTREVNKMLARSRQLLHIVSVSDGAGNYPCYILGKPREGTEMPTPASVRV